MTSERAQRSRDYGGWRRRRGIGLWGLGAGGTLAMLAGLLVLILVAAADVTVLAYVAPPVLIAMGLALVRISGEPVAFRGIRRLRWWYGSARSYNKYRVGVV